MQCHQKKACIYAINIKSISIYILRYGKMQNACLAIVIRSSPLREQYVDTSTAAMGTVIITDYYFMSTVTAARNL